MERDLSRITYFPNVLEVGRKLAQELAQEMTQAEADSQVLNENYPWLQEQHPRCWVAVFQGQIVGISKRSQSSLIRALRKKGLTQEQIAQVRVRYIRAKGDERPRILLNAA